MTETTTPEWEQRCDALWDTIDDHTPAQFRAMIAELAADLPDGHPVGHFERASACDATDQEEEAARLYRRALAAGLSGGRRRQAVIQLASTLRLLGQPEASVEMLAAERDADADELDDAVTAFLALALIDTGREREAAALALGALSRHLPRYTRSVAQYAEDAQSAEPAAHAAHARNV